MRKLLLLALTFFTVMNVLHIPQEVYASEDKISVTVEYFCDGTYTETYIEEINSLFRSQTKSGTKTMVKKAADGSKLWSVAVTGSFTYDGTTAKCTSASVSTECWSSNWKKSSASASKSGATATGSAVFKRYNGLTVVESVTGKVTLTCSSSGKLS